MASLSTTYARWDRFAADSDDGAEPAAPAPVAPVASAPALDDDASAPTDDLDPDVARGLDETEEAVGLRGGAEVAEEGGQQIARAPQERAVGGGAEQGLPLAQ